MTEEELQEAWTYTKGHYGIAYEENGVIQRMSLPDAVRLLPIDARVVYWYLEMEGLYDDA